MPAAPSASVFINCPFDKQYQPIFDAIVFCIAACGFVPRCTLELTDAGEVRIENIYRLIAQCNHSIHDISRTEVEGQPYRLPRFNMPLELGIFLGAKRFGGRSSRKRCLVMDRAPYRYKRFISDIGGQDIKAHYTRPVKQVDLTLLASISSRLSFVCAAVSETLEQLRYEQHGLSAPVRKRTQRVGAVLCVPYAAASRANRS